jgi:hypothetical protein
MLNIRKSPYPYYQSNNPLLSDHANDLDIFLGKPFWCGKGVSIDTPLVDCCFNHMIGLPEKNSKIYPIFDYELDVISKIESNRNIWIKKASGIGATELILRFLTWKILVNNDLEHKSIFIVSGTFQQHANDVKIRMENLFRKKFPLMQLESKFTDLWIKNTNVKIFPSRNVKDLRGYTDVSYLFIDEADYFEPSVTTELEHAITRYEEKCNCTSIMVSTPNAPGGLFQKIEVDPLSKYHKIILDYTVGLGKIYDPEEIKRKMNEPEFQREYAGKYLGKVGNFFTSSQIDLCQQLGEEYSIDKIPVSLYTLKSCGLDPAFGSSSDFGFVTLEHIKVNRMSPTSEDKHIIRVLDCHLIQRADPNQMVELCWNTWKKHGYMNTVYFIDGSNAAMCNLLRLKWNESLSWSSKDSFSDTEKIRPVNFSTEHRNMLSNLHALVSKGFLAIDPKYDKLITSLRTAYAEELNLKKDIGSYSYLLDGLRLALKAYHF